MKKFINFWFRYFSENTINTKDWWVRDVVWFIMALPMIIGVIINVTHNFKGGLGWALIGGGILGIFAIIWIFVFFYHNWLIKKENEKNS